MHAHVLKKILFEDEKKQRKTTTKFTEEWKTELGEKSQHPSLRSKPFATIAYQGIESSCPEPLCQFYKYLMN